MTPADIIFQALDHTEEYREMTSTPNMMITYYLAHRVLKQQDEIMYLKRRIQYENNRH